MTSKLVAPPPSARDTLWPALLAVAAIGGSWALACVTPFAAFAAILAATGRPGTAFGTVALIWIANQAVGVMLLGYPLDAHSLGWGIAIGAAALLATLAASAVTGLALRRSLRLVLGFVAAFVVYETALALLAAATGELANFAPAIVGRLALIEAAWLAALVVLHDGLALLGWRPADRRIAA